MPAEGFRQRQIGHVDAGDKKNEGHRSQQNQQRGPHIGNHIVVQGDDDRAPSLIVLGIKLLEPPGDCIHLRLRLLQFNSTLKASDDPVMMLSAHGTFLVSPSHWGPHLRKARKPEAWRHDAGDEIAGAIQIDVAPHDFRIRAEVFLPQTMAQNYNVRAPRLIFVGGKLAAQHRLNPQGCKETRRDGAGIDLLRLVGAGQVESAGGVDCHPVEYVVLFFPVQIVRGRG